MNILKHFMQFLQNHYKCYMHNLKGGGNVSTLSSHLIAPIMCINKLNTLYCAS